eukprot:TRINITY_DN329_c0_g1_i2.p1 TRINITY_DN329_c0_g1~~TRINITY_DN329_c0_g1_i2.p1  ORF type:complete len:705 (+),score=98.29 TRINITY_DN329_c0_g1_i2:237-2351(+)
MNFLFILTKLPLLLAEFATRQTQNPIETLKSMHVLINIHNSTARLPDVESSLSVLGEGDECVNTILRMVNNFTTDPLLKRLHSFSGKFFNQYGDYRGCTEDGNRYIMLKLIFFRLGLCVPTQCAHKHIDAINKYIESLMEPYKHILRFIKDAIRLFDVKAENAKKPTPGTYVTIAVISFILLVSILAAILNFAISKERWNTRSRKAVESFDIMHNAQHLFCSENKVDKNLDVLNGIKVLFMAWIVQAHLIMDLAITMPSNGMFVSSKKVFAERHYAIYPSATYSVDVFFWLTGFLAVLVITEQLKNRRRNIVPAVLLIYAHRYLRMLPIYIFAVITPFYIMPYLYDGPNYDVAKGMNDMCMGNWLYNFLYVNVYFNDNQGCMGWTWYIANDFQIYLLVPPLVLLYLWKQFVAYAVVGILMVASIGIQFKLMAKYNLSANFSGSGREQLHFQREYYNKPYCRINPFLIGILMAWIYLAYKQAKKASNTPEEEREICQKSFINRMNYAIVHSWVLRYSLYIAGLTITSTCVYTYFDFFKLGADKSQLENHFYVVFARPGFALGLSLVIYPACLGKARVLRAVLGYHAFNVLAKSIYAVYMLHMEVLKVYWGMRQTHEDFTEYNIWTQTIDCYVLSCAVAVIATLVFEYPVIGLSKEFLRPKRAQIIGGKSCICHRKNHYCIHLLLLILCYPYCRGFGVLGFWGFLK